MRSSLWKAPKPFRLSWYLSTNESFHRWWPISTSASPVSGCCFIAIISLDSISSMSWTPHEPRCFLYPPLHVGHRLHSLKNPITPSTAALTAAISSSMTEPPNTALQPTYAGNPVFRANILATRVAKSMLPGTAYRDVLRGSEGSSRLGMA